MKRIIITLFAFFMTVGMFAQSTTLGDFDGSEFENMAPEANAKAFTDYLKTFYKLDDTQYQAIYDIRLKSAKHVKMLDNAVANGESNVGYQEKRSRIIEAGIANALNKFNKQQMNKYKAITVRAEANAERARLVKEREAAKN
jgi:hypothetical protein